MKLDASTVKLEIFTFKEGLLSAAGHDLVLGADGIDVEVAADPLGVVARIDPRRIHVLPAVHGLSAHDRAQIEKAMLADVLDAKHHAEIVFRSSRVAADAARIAIEGELTLAGHTRAVAVTFAAHDDAWQAETVLSQPDFGVRPYTAMLGALKVKPDVRVRITVAKAALAALVP